MKCHNTHCEQEAIIECGMGKRDGNRDCKMCFLENAYYVIRCPNMDAEKFEVQRILLKNPDIALEIL